jgi:hypothetical protein
LREVHVSLKTSLFRVSLVSWSLGGALVSPVVGCEYDAQAPTGPTVEVRVAPLSLPGIRDACYRVTVSNGAGGVVNSVVVSSSQYGDGAGAATYVTPCDASDGVEQNSVVLDVLGLYTSPVGDCGAAPASEPFVNPGPLTRPFTCRENADVAVVFDVTLMRPASQGFFDVAVSFEDVFCSAKFDCAYADGRPIELLFDADRRRAATAVFALACTAGPDTDGADAATTLHLDDLTIECGGAPASVVVDPAAGLGNQYTPPRAAGTSIIYQAQVSAGVESLIDAGTGGSANKLYWTTALGVDLAALATAPAGCRVTTRFTASWGANDPSWTPTGIYPEIALDVPLTVAPTGRLACGGDDRHGLDELLEAGAGYLETSYPVPMPTFIHAARDNGAGALALESAASASIANELTPAASYISLATFGSGKVLAFYRDGNNDEASTVSIHDASGVRLAGPNVIAPVNNFSAAATLSDGNVALVYSDAEDGQAGKVVVVRDDGTQMFLPSTFASFANHVAVAGFGNGNMLVAWGSSPKYTVVNASGIAGEAIGLAAAGVRSSLMDAITLANGTVLLAWVEDGDRPGRAGLGRFAIIGPGGNLVVAPTTFDASVDSDSGSFNLDLARSGDGHVAVVYSRERKAYLTVLASDGQVVTPPVIFLASSAVSMTATAAPGGRILVALRDASNNNLTTWRVLDEAGATVVGPVQFVADDGFAYNQAESTTLPNGAVFLGYAETLNGSAPERGLLLAIEPATLTP